MTNRWKKQRKGGMEGGKRIDKIHPKTYNREAKKTEIMRLIIGSGRKATGGAPLLGRKGVLPGDGIENAKPEESGSKNGVGAPPLLLGRVGGAVGIHGNHIQTEFWEKSNETEERCRGIGRDKEGLRLGGKE